MTGLLPVGPASALAIVVGSSVGDFVWNDTNKDGVQDASESGIGNVDVTLTGTNDVGETISMHTTTTADGKYIFAGLRAGDYRVVVDKTTLPERMINTYSLGGTTAEPSNDSLLFVLAANEERTDVDFGYYETPPPPSPIETVKDVIADAAGRLSETGQSWLVYISGAVGLLVLGARSLAQIRR